MLIYEIVQQPKPTQFSMFSNSIERVELKKHTVVIDYTRNELKMFTSNIMKLKEEFCKEHGNPTAIYVSVENFKMLVALQSPFSSDLEYTSYKVNLPVTFFDCEIRVVPEAPNDYITFGFSCPIQQFHHLIATSKY